MLKLGFALSILVLPFAVHSVQAQAAEAKAGTATVSGRVTLKGEPARGVMVILQSQDRNASNAPRASADEGGRFYFTGLTAGKYSISALAPGYVSPDEPGFPGLRGRTLNLTDGDRVENIDLEIKRGGVIAGRVTDSQGRPVVEEKVNLFKLNPSNISGENFYLGANYEMYQTDDRGHYRIYGLPEGRYLVSVGHAESFGSANIISTREFYPRVFYQNAASHSEAKMIEVSEGSEATNIDITVPDPKQTHDVYGRVVDAGSGRPVSGVEVAIGGVTREGKYTGGYAGDVARSGPNGEFVLFGALPGRYALLVQPEESSGFVGAPVIFDISEGDATGLELRVSKGASISGVAVIEGTNDPNVLSKLSKVRLVGYIQRESSNAPPAPFGRRLFNVNAGGGFRIEGLQAGKAKIMMIPPPELRGLALGKIEHNGAPAIEIDVNPGEQVTGVRLVLVYGPLTLRGEVKIVGGEVPAGQKFRAIARRMDQPMHDSHAGDVDARGQFVIENLVPGEYEIRVTTVYNPDGPQLSSEIMRRIYLIKERVLERVVLNSANQQPITLVIDLSQKEGDR
jgi:protocatechuate 3,4-dioxygenase beta subunit